ncbi:MAG: fibronectin type III domain-containing protein [Bacteroidota bacterium]
MKKIFQQKGFHKIRYILCVWLLAANGYVFAQQTTTVLPNNASFSNKSGPQGALRYQRELYLITAAEMAGTGITNGMAINSIGFTIGKAQSDTTKGHFKAYLENTTDFTSRIDTNWISMNSPTNSYNAVALFPGNYEWQVQANCSPFTISNYFSNESLSGCNSPYNLNSTNLTSNSATLEWESVTSPAFTQYQVEYSRVDVINWISNTSATPSFNLAGLDANTTYQWRVKTICSAGTTAYVYSSFSTNNLNACLPPSGFSHTVSQDTLVTLNWTAAAGAISYEIQYRRVSTNSWSIAFAFTNSAVVDLEPGTTYEWQVRTICGPGAAGAYIYGTNFATGGTPICYPPTNSKTSQITGNSAILSWGSVEGATSYTIRYRLKNTISWVNAIAPMILASDSAITLPDTVGIYDIPFAKGNPFTYTGGGLYIAWEYSRPIGALTSPNVTLSTTRGSSIPGVSGQDSVVFIRSLVSLADTNHTALPEILGAVKERPETRLGSTSLADSVAIVAVYALGKTAPQYLSPTPISALISNKSASDQTYDVTLTVREQSTGALRYSIMQSLPVAAGDSATIEFNGWSPSLYEKDSIFVSIPAEPGENVVNNNTKSYVQEVTKNLLAYDDGTPMISEAGFGTGSGLLLNKHEVTGCAKVIAAQVFLTESSKGHALKAVIFNSAMAQVGESELFTPDSSMTNRYHSFYFTSPPSFLNEEFYIGLAQEASVNEYNPVGAQWEDQIPRTGVYYRADLLGAVFTDFPQQGRLMIGAELVPSSAEPSILGNLTICTASTTDLTASSDQKRYANKVINASSQSGNVDYSGSQALGTPNVFPVHGLSPKSWVSASPDSQREHLVLGFANPAKINFIEIFETANPGAIDTIFVKNSMTMGYDIVYSAAASPKPLTAIKNRISFPLTTYDVSEIRIAMNSPAVPGYNAIDAVAIGESSNTTFASYLWSPGGETSDSKTVSTPGQHTLTVTNASGCSLSETVTVTSTTTVPPVITASGPLNICQGDSVILVSNQSFGITWSDNSTNDSLVVKTAGSYTVSYNDGAGCGSIVSLPVVIVVNSLPTVSISGGSAICPGGSTILDAGAGYLSYQWSTGQNSQTINASLAGTYSVTVTNLNGCTGSGTITVTNAPVPTPSITGTLQICPGSSTLLDAGGGYSSYAWSTGAISQTINVSSAGSYTVTVTNSNGCVGSASTSTSVLTPPTPFISGKSAFCPTSSISLTANPGYSSYLWSTGGTTANISVNSIGTYTVTVTASNGCTGTASKAITQAIPPSPTIAGTLSFCGSSTTALNAGSGYIGYLWSTGATSQSILVSTAATFQVTVTDANGCTGTASVATTKTGSIPATPGPITGNSGGVCNSTGNIYSISPVLNAAFYVWKVPVGALITSGQGSTSITVSYTMAFVGGNIVVAASNACGQSPSRNARTLAIIGSAATPSAIAGLTNGVCGLTNQIYSITAINGASSYLWTVPAGVTVMGGQGTTSLTVNFASNFASGNICVQAISACGNSGTKCLAITGAPGIPVAITGASSVCAKANNVAYSIVAVAGASSYTWTVPDQSIIVSGQGTTNIVVNFGNKPSNISVKANNTCGSSSEKSLAVAFTPGCKPTSEEAVVEQIGEQLNVNLFPNPSNGLVNIDLINGKKGKYQIEVNNIIGQKVYADEFEWEGKSIKADFSKLEKGLYIVSIFNEQNRKFTKLILQ